MDHSKCPTYSFAEGEEAGLILRKFKADSRVRFSCQRLAEWKDIDETAQILLKEFPQ